MKSFVIKIEQDLLATKPIRIVPVYDLHIGSKNHARTLWKKVKEEIKKDDRTYWFGGGDYAEFIHPKDKRFDPDNLDPKALENLTHITNWEIEYIAKEFHDIKDKCLFLLTGNHDDKYRSEYGIDLVREIALKIGITPDDYRFTFPYEAMARLIIGKSTTKIAVDIYASHGWGGGLYKGAKINRIERITEAFDADLYFAGHSHDTIASPKDIIQFNKAGEIEVRRRYLCRVGGFRYSRTQGHSYEEKAGMHLSGVGTTIISIYREYGSKDKWGKRYEVMIV